MMKNKNIIKNFFIASVALLIFFSFFHPVLAQSGENPLEGTNVNEIMKNQSSPAATTQSPAGATPAVTGSGGAYTNQEKIPGAEPTSEFIPYLKSIINFGFAIIGILALFMLIIGAYQYLMAAGSGKAEGAKETISSALLGLILGLCAWIILYKINPDLVNMNSITQITGGGQSAQTGNPQNNSGQPYTGSTGNGSCDPNQGACQSSNLACFGSGANAASQICGYESAGGNPLRLSGTDKTTDGKSFSVGLFQLNLTVHDLGMGCTSAFSGKNYSATVVNQSLYDQCVAKAQDPSFNTSYACQLYKSRGSFGDWSNTVSKCGV